MTLRNIPDATFPPPPKRTQDGPHRSSYTYFQNLTTIQPYPSAQVRQHSGRAGAILWDPAAERYGVCECTSKKILVVV